jgi:ribonuclease I
MNCLKWFTEFLNIEKIDDTHNEALIHTYDLKNYYYLCIIRDSENDDWSIHGLWPQYSAGSYPTYCKQVSFDINKLDPIINELTAEWYSTEEPDDEFWKHEWQKHGSCMFTSMDELTYFSTALKLFDSIKNNDSIIEKYKTRTNQSMIPYDQNFNIINTSSD